ncbi:hypothetical protein V6N12_031994 [Hibiscus sabdariffa]|uniref:DUF4283 domain-containing protein n=1 Tax=Hibiscus sabdariffa TaxID=183260 RepID=A0ABR2BYS2_9ROSI
MGDQCHVTVLEEGDLNDDEIELFEGDVTHSNINGLMSIEFSDKVQALAIKSFQQTVVIKLLGRRIGYTTLKTRLQDLWKPIQSFKLMGIKNDYFMATFRNHSDYLQAIDGGTWMILGHYLIVEPWIVDFSTSQPHPNRVVAWVRLPGLPPLLYRRNLITEIDIFLSFNPPNPTLPPTPSPSAATFEESPYGPWMVVDRRQLRNPKATPHALAPKETREPMSARSSRFAPIAEEEVTEISMHSPNASKGEGTTNAPTGVGTTSALNAIKFTKKKGHSDNLHLSPPKSSTRTSYRKLTSTTNPRNLFYARQASGSKSRHTAVIIEKDAAPFVPIPPQQQGVDHMTQSTTPHLMSHVTPIDPGIVVPIVLPTTNILVASNDPLIDSMAQTQPTCLPADNSNDSNMSTVLNDFCPTPSLHCANAYPIVGYSPPLPSSATNHLDDVPSPLEIREALFDMAPLKAPCPDGLHVFALCNALGLFSHYVHGSNNRKWTRAIGEYSSPSKSQLYQSNYVGFESYSLSSIMAWTFMADIGAQTPFFLYFQRKRISIAWDSFRDNIIWLIGDGNVAHLWDDVWVPTLGPLHQWSLSSATSLENLSISNLVLLSGNWDMDKLSNLLQPVAIPHVIGTTSPGMTGHVDACGWRWNSN